ncbi:hypothetical protein ACJ2_42610 [Pantoea sp. QMID2]|nr:hypothetical protein ACJ3_42620 [Pantoea sp. QMID3]GME47460.1 hypothetical protein ACJ1_42590 [Pantoea sp. QMID1]GME62207.1 hypothetical protein ACJ4_42510 [Pantoea sp. QMID4]GME63533.1 hypothetical protein ACJ2_42610 [Pantoea sp. QMID2]
MSRILSPINNYDITIAETEVPHTVSTGANEEGRGAPADAKLVKIEFFLNVILSGGGEAGRARISIQRYPDAGRK